MGIQWLSEFERVMWYADLAGICALIASLALNGLYRRYRFLFAYLLADAAETMAGLALVSRTGVYAQMYMLGQTVKLVLAVFVVLELYRVTLADHPALARFGRSTAGYVMSAAAAIAASSLFLDYSADASWSAALHRFLMFERAMDAWMLVFLLAIVLFITWFPVRLSRNSALYLAGFVVYFLSRALGLLAVNLAPKMRQNLNAAMLSVALVCLAAWITALRPRGEDTTLVIGHRWNRGEMERLSGQLDAINQRLGRLGRATIRN